MNQVAPPAFAVIDPETPAGRRFVAAFGSDSVRLESHRMHGLDGRSPFFKVDVGSLGPAQLAAACREVARVAGLTEAGAYHQVVQADGLALAADRVYVCVDPVVGREFFALRRASARGGGPT